MTTGTQLDELQILRGFLQERLQLELPHSVPFGVQCVIKNGELIILAQHPPGRVPAPQQIFRVLKQAVPPQQPEFPNQVKLYLRVVGQNRPYAFDKFTVEPPKQQEASHSTSLRASLSPTKGVNEFLLPPPLVPPSSSVNSTKGISGERPSDEITGSKLPDSQHGRLEEPFNWDRVDETDESPSTSPTSVDGEGSEEIDLRESFPKSLPASPTTDEPVSTTNPWERLIPLLDSKSDEVPRDTVAQETWSAQSSPTSDSKQKTQNSNRFQSLRPSGPLIIVGTGIAALCFFCTLYVLTRPCALGASCMQIAEAQRLRKESDQTFQQPSSGKEILEAQKQLESAIDILETIPYWSSHYNEAQNLVKADRTEAKIVDEVVKALKKGAVASVKSQNPPHTLSEWLDIQKRWREAALQLEQIPKDSNIYPLAQQKQKAYKANLAVTNQRLTVEQQAKQFLNAAQEAAKKAEARQGVAQSLESWYLVYSTWQMALNRLSEIPQGTTAYEAAQQLLPEYQTKLVAVRDRTTIEQFAANTYKQSLHLAQQAKNFQATNQWSQAVVGWSNALIYLRQIPNGTYYYGKTADAINAYTEALKQAQAQLQIANLLQQARSDLNQTCGAKPQICTFTITRDLIKVRLTSDYMQKVRNAALAAKARNDYNAQAGVVKHVLTLGEALEAISDNAKTRLEVYTPDGNLRQAHNPA